MDDYIKKWTGTYPPHRGEASKAMFLDDVRKVSGVGLNDAREAARIEDWDFAFTVERLQGKRPPERQLKIDALEHRLQRIESLLNLS